MAIARFVRSVLRAYAAYPLLFAVVLGAVAYQVAFNVIVSLATKKVFDDVVKHHDTAGLTSIAVGLGGALVVRIVLAFALDYAVALLASHANAGLRERMFAALQAKPSVYFARTPMSDVIARFSTDLAVVEGSSNRFVARVLLLILNIAACTVTMFALDARLALGATVAIVVALALPGPMGARAAKANVSRREAERDVFAIVQESIALQSVVRAFGLGKHVRGKYEEGLTRFRVHARRAIAGAGLVETSTVVLLLVLQVFVLVAGAALILRSGRDDAGALAAFLPLLASVASSVNGLSGVVPTLIEAAGSRERIDELLETDANGRATETVELPPLTKKIALEEVSFSYTGDRDDIRDVSLEIPAGTSVAFVGPSGSGKSTLLSLVTRTNQPTKGRISIDDHDLQAASAESLYRQMSIVAQESLLFDTTIRENIRAGRLAASDEEIETAARRAEVHETILALANGYETRVGERGANLSGGQRQRIAIARAVLREPRLLVLDEATSALDPATEQALTRTLDTLRPGRTIVSVTHRLATIIGYDRIFVMKDGRLVESGTHDELLLDEAGTYRDMWEKQNGVIVNADASLASLTPAFLDHMPLFESLDDATKEELARRFATMRFNAGHVIFRAGDPGDAFYVVAHGQVEIEVPGRRPRVCVPGEAFGEIALLEARTRTATARAETKCTLLVLARQHFDELLAREPIVAAELKKKARFHLANDLERVT